MTNRPVGERVLLPESTRPSPTTLHGRTVRLVPLGPQHAAELYPLISNDHPDQTALWDYIPDGPYSDLSALERDFTARPSSTDPVFFAILDTRPAAPTAGKAVGYIALMSIVPEHRRLEIGHVIFSRLIQRTTGATEAIYLLLRHSIETLGYRRIEWKCNALNEASRRAALRIGFLFEGVFRQHMVVKGRNRDTAWFSIMREEWDGLKEGLEGWLAERNFGEDGRQIKRLEDIRGEI
ncbi:acyl-CoA N-acyltransferase [Aspergillus cavernicola]|uniref:Acyl-CoA N-acyltransferase n=1 Tax=Aspergillus cavernicola TaxID=176166 RepID=A0ABR4HUU9_9EURO